MPSLAALAVGAVNVTSTSAVLGTWVAAMPLVIAAKPRPVLRCILMRRDWSEGS
jgi:hypothetical protein